MSGSSPAIIFGLKDYPRPRQSGFFYHKPPTFLGNFQIKTLAVLDLFVTDEAYIESVLSAGINKLLEDPEIAADKAHYLTHYTTENMKPFTQKILADVIQRKLAAADESHPPASSP